MRIALVDPASFVLPYDVALVRGLLSNNHTVTLYCSNTSYNGELLHNASFFDQQNPDASFQVFRFDVSRTVARNRVVGLFNYALMLLSVFKRRRYYDTILLQFGIFLPFELLFFLANKRAVSFVIHDDVPHGFRRSRHWPTIIRALCSQRIIFVSEIVRCRFFSNSPIGRLNNRAVVLQHGTLSAYPSKQSKSLFCETHERAILTFFGAVKPYKGIETLVSVKPLMPEVPFEIFGRWEVGLLPVAQRARALGIRVEDGFLTNDSLDQILQQRRVFILPYQKASQSGVLYLLLHYARPFVSTDSGDLGFFLKKHGLHELLFDSNDPADVAESVRWALANYDALVNRLQEIRLNYDWGRIISAHPMFRE
jgi:glycosyltransferase involved in cell wall biosynthesis